MSESFARWRIQNALYALVLCALCPALLVLVALGLRDFREHDKQVCRQAQNIAFAIAAQQKNLTEGTRNLLHSLARLPEMKNLDAPVLTKLFTGLVADNPNYTTFVVLDREGRLIASDAASRGQFSAADRRYFLEALRTAKFSAGEYAVGRLSGLASFHFSVPVYGEDGEVVAVAAAGVKLDGYDAILADITMPAGWRYILHDRNGIRLHRYPRDDRLGPGTMASEDVRTIINNTGVDQGVFSGSSTDGVEMNIAFVNLRLSPDADPYMTVIVGIPKSALIQTLANQIGPALTLLAVTMLLALLIARILGRKLIGAGVEQLAQATRALAFGDLSARAGEVPACLELRSLGTAFDAMADNLSKEITERRRAVDALEQAEAKYRTLIENSPVGVYRASPEGRFLLANQALADMLGYASPEELVAVVGDIGKQVFASEDRALELVAVMRKKGWVTDFEAQNRRKDGTIVWTSRNCRATRDETGAIAYWDGFVSDITGRKELDRIREDVDRILRHDLRTPLQGILAVPGLLAFRGNVDEEDRTILGMLTRCGHRMLHMINMSLEMFKIETGTYKLSPSPIDIVKIVRDAAEEMSVFVEMRQIELRVTLDGVPARPGEAFMTEGEELLCFTMMENLLRNAFEAAPRDSAVTVDLRLSPPAIRVRNLGEVPAAIRGNFFAKYTTLGKKQGTGLGAYSAMRIAKTHGFCIELDCSVAGETTLVIGLPRAEIKAAAGQDIQAVEPAPREHGPWRVLLAEDSDTSRAMLAMFLQDAGHEVTAVANGAQAIAALGSGRFDLVLMDMMMPEMDGLEAAARIRAGMGGQFCRDVPILGITASDAENDRERCLAAGMDQVVAKPVLIDDLRRAMAEIMDKRLLAKTCGH